jgi:hypothetical protein
VITEELPGAKLHFWERTSPGTCTPPPQPRPGCRPASLARPAPARRRRTCTAKRTSAASGSRTCRAGSAWRSRGSRARVGRERRRAPRLGPRCTSAFECRRRMCRGRRSTRSSCPHSPPDTGRCCMSSTGSSARPGCPSGRGCHRSREPPAQPMPASPHRRRS